MKYLFYFLIFFVVFITNVNAETIIYDDITTSNFKLLKIDDIANIKHINEYNYDVLINNSFYGTFGINDNIFIPDNSSIQIYIKETINTDIKDSYDVGKVYLTLGIMYFIGFAIIIIIIGFGFRKILGR